MNIEWARRWADAFNRHDHDAVMACYTDDLFFEDIFFQIEMRGRVAFDQAIRVYADAPHESSNEVIDYIGGADGGAIRWIWHFRGNGQFMGYDVTGRELHIPGFSVVKFRDGRIYHESDIVDGIGAFEALGIVEKEPVAAIDPMHGSSGWRLVLRDGVAS